LEQVVNTFVLFACFGAILVVAFWSIKIFHPTKTKSARVDDSPRYPLVKAALEDRIIHWVTDKPPEFYTYLDDKFSTDGVEITKEKDGFWVNIEDKHFKFGLDSVCKRVFEQVWDADELLARAQNGKLATKKDPICAMLRVILAHPELITKVDDDETCRCILSTALRDYSFSYWYGGLEKHYARGTDHRLSGEAAELAAAVFAQHMKKKDT
jgi:hypothetical protein